ncbi:hypothetical protein [Marinobacterium aestuariivivens]|uniref:Uncharacterized protein n=1 Tax=Marinobacterium aestuariivivens TaxID=1698799 RepID=A0ABW2A1R2_9GAMM
MTDPRHPDIEIYVKNCSLEQLEQWLRNRCSTFEKKFSQGLIHEYDGIVDETKVPVMIHEKVVGKAWTSVWFKSDRTLDTRSRLRPGSGRGTRDPGPVHCRWLE